MAVLTDINGDRHYCAVLSFAEAVSKEDLEDQTKTGKAADEEMEQDMTVTSGPISLLQHKSLPRHLVPGVSLVADDAHMFAPKCLVLLSRHDDPETLRSCLGVIYTAYSECLVGPGGERIRLETLVGNLLGWVHVSAPGGPQTRFSLGAGDRMLISPPAHPAVPVTGTKVAILFRQLGIANVLTLFCAAMTELKILFYSRSFNRLTEACTALVALMYPMKYMHSFIPILPASVGEMWSSPMPFIIGVHASRQEEVSDLLDVVKVDLDGGAIAGTVLLLLHMQSHDLYSRTGSSLLAEWLHGGTSSARQVDMSCERIPFACLDDPKFQSRLNNCSVFSVPDNYVIHLIHGEMLATTQNELSSVLHPDLAAADDAFGPTRRSAEKPPASLDKELRAVMLRLMVRLLSSYRSCLTLVRIHPKPYITFHKSAFLGSRGLCDSEFVRRMLDCMFFNSFVSERGPPWRR